MEGNWIESEIKKEPSQVKTIISSKIIKHISFIKIISLIQIFIFIYQLIHNFIITNSLIQTHPFNYLIGPTSEVIILEGARFIPCMKHTMIEFYSVQCPSQSNSITSNSTCTLNQLCGFNENPDFTPNQWYRFVIPLFLHAGVLHILFNLISQYQIGLRLEMQLGSLKLSLIYLLSGIFGFIFGANFSSIKMASVGASGAIFGLLGSDLALIIMNWKKLVNPLKQIYKLIVIILFSLLLGLIPYIDNFAHIGGFFTGIFSTLMLVQFQQYKKIARISIMGLGLLLILLIFIFGLFAFYSFSLSQECAWCKYFNCIPFTPGMCSDL